MEALLPLYTQGPGLFMPAVAKTQANHSIFTGAIWSRIEHFSLACTKGLCIPPGPVAPSRQNRQSCVMLAPAGWRFCPWWTVFGALALGVVSLRLSWSDKSTGGTFASTGLLQFPG